MYYAEIVQAVKNTVLAESNRRLIYTDLLKFINKSEEDYATGKMKLATIIDPAFKDALMELYEYEEKQHG